MKMNQNDEYPFRPRGIVKWHAFAAVISGDEQKESVITKDIVDIELMEDTLNVLNTELLEAYNNNRKVIIEYVENNKISKGTFTIKKIDKLNEKIYLNDKELDIFSIISINQI
ncbi:MAG: YolD-like family protein [Erysipelotrichales bacterium]